MRRKMSLRLILALIAATSMGLAWWANRVRARRAAVAAILRSGGGVAYDYQFTHGDLRTPNPNGRSPAPDWARTTLGDEVFSDVLEVGFTSNPPNEEALIGLRSFGGLRCLYINGPGFGDAQVKHLENLPGPDELYLGSTDITDASVPVLKRLGGLKELNIGSTKISVDGMKELQRSLPRTRITH